MSNDRDQVRAKARDTFHKHLDYLSSGRTDEWVGLWNENGVLEFPFRLSIYPEKVTGKNEIREYIRHFPDYLEVVFSAPSFYDTEDPSLVIAEFEAKGKMKTTGNPYNQRYISVVKTSGGKIDFYRDFWDPVVLQTALGQGNQYAGAAANL
jgi:uncharacterized protein